MKFVLKFIALILALYTPHLASSGQISVINPSASSSLIATGNVVSPPTMTNTATNSTINSTSPSGIQAHGVGPHALSKIDKIANIFVRSQPGDVDRKNIKLLENDILLVLQDSSLSSVDRTKFELLLSKLRQGLN